MLNYDEMLMRLRRSLRDPDPHEPGDDFLLQCLADAGQELRNMSSLLGAGVEQGSVSLSLNTSTAIYSLSSVPQAGRILRVHIIDPSSSAPTQRYLKIPVIERQDMGNYSELPGAILAPSACIVWVEDGIRKIEFVPAPSRSLSGKVWFEVGYLNVMRTDAIDILPEFHHLQRLKAAVIALPHCEWGSMRIDDDTVPRLDRETLYMKKRDGLIKNLMLATGASIAQQEKSFAMYSAKLSSGGTESSSACYASEYMEGYF